MTLANNDHLFWHNSDALLLGFVNRNIPLPSVVTHFMMTRGTNLMQQLWFIIINIYLHVSGIYMPIFRSTGCVLLHMVFSTRCCGCGLKEPVCSLYMMHGHTYMILWSYPTECWYLQSLGIIYSLFWKVSWAAKIIQWAISFTWSWILPAKFDVESFYKRCVGHDGKHKNSNVPDRD